MVSLFEKVKSWLFPQGELEKQHFSQVNANEQIDIDQRQIGLSFYNKKLYSEAFTFLLPVALKGDVESQEAVGAILFERKEYIGSIKMFTMAGNNGSPAAQEILGRIYYDGVGILPDKERSFYWFSKAAESDRAFSQQKLVKMYAEGIGVKADMVLAGMWLSVFTDNESCSNVEPESLTKITLSSKQLDEVKLRAEKWKMNHRKGNYQL